MTPTLTTVLSLAMLYTANLTAIVLVLARKRDAPSVMSWLFAIIFLPGLGLLLFILFGLERIPRGLKKRIAYRKALPPRVAAVANEAFTDFKEGGRGGWEKLCELAEKCGAPPVRAGNKVTMLPEGSEAFESIFEAIRGAKHHVHVEEYIFRVDRLGQEMLDLLIAKIKEGVQVRVIVDAFGSLTSWRLLKQLRAAGGQGVSFMPLHPLRRVYLPNLRNHRKIIVCDGDIGFLGGLNVGEEYASKRFKRRHWQDAHVRIQGPAVLDLQRVFVDDWEFAADESLKPDEFFPAATTRGDSRAQIIASGPDVEVNAVRQVMFGAITRAQRSIQIATPYLVPDQAIRDALTTAARRGVEVIILTQGWPPDHWPTYWCSRYFWGELLEAGVKMYAYQAGFMHAKVMVVDEHWSNIGSANIDNRSLRLNFEVMAVLDSDSDVALVRERFKRELAKSKRVTLEEFNKRPLSHRILEGFMRLFAPLL
ncbi:MAG: cardiolipin synthase [Planctomycetes bacterium]|nr:cardiolipin synthase [Planctomycetota bacterium]